MTAAAVVNDLTGEQWAWEGIEIQEWIMQGCKAGWQVFNGRGMNVCPGRNGRKNGSDTQTNDSAK